MAKLNVVRGAMLVLPWVIACGDASGGGESSSTGDSPTTTDGPTTSGEPTSSGDPTTSGEPTTSGDPTTTGTPETDGETDTGPPLVVCDAGDVRAGFTVDVGTLPLTPLAASGAGARHLRVSAECTVDPASTTHAIVLVCAGSDDAPHDVTIELDADVPVAPSLAAEADVTLTYVSDGWLTTSCPSGGAVGPSIWFEVRDAASSLQLGGAAGGWYTPVAPKGEDPIDWFAPHEVRIADHCQGESEDKLGCTVRLLALSVVPSDEVLVVGSEVQVDGLSFALESGSQIYVEPDHFCCAESRETELQLLVVALPPA